MAKEVELGCVPEVANEAVEAVCEGRERGGGMAREMVDGWKTGCAGCRQLRRFPHSPSPQQLLHLKTTALLTYYIISMEARAVVQYSRLSQDTG